MKWVVYWLVRRRLGHRKITRGGGSTVLEGEESSSWDAVRRKERFIQCMVEMVSSYYQAVGMEGS